MYLILPAHLPWAWYAFSQRRSKKDLTNWLKDFGSKLVKSQSISSARSATVPLKLMCFQFCKCNSWAEKGGSGRKGHSGGDVSWKGIGCPRFWKKREEKDDVLLGLVNGTFYVRPCLNLLFYCWLYRNRGDKKREARRGERGQGGSRSLLGQRNSRVLQHRNLVVSILHFFFRLDSNSDESSSINTICFLASDSWPKLTE